MINDPDILMHVYDLQDTQIILRKTDNIQKLYLEVSSQCNFACEMCFRHSFSTPFGSMSEELLNKVRDEIETLPGLKEIVLGGLGEPLLHPQINELISFIKSKGISVTITTNGALLESFIDFFIEQEVDKIVLSFETGDIGHANENYLFNTIENIKQKKDRLKKNHPVISISMVVTRENIHDLAHIAKRIRNSDTREVLLSNLLPANEEHRELVLYPMPEPDEIKTFKTDLFRNILLDKVSCNSPAFEIKTERSCDFIENRSLVVRWDGEVSPCYRLLYSRNEIILNNTKEIKACSFGNIREQSLLDIWNGREYTWFRFTVHNSRYPSCIDCPLRDGCEFVESTKADCWGNENSCADCLWARRFVKCP